MDFRELSTEKRRELQREAGLEVLPQLQLVETETMANGTDVQIKPTKGKNQRPPNQAPLTEMQMSAQSVRHIFVQSMTWKQVVILELKRAAVWAPILAATGFGTLWASKRLFKL